MYSDAFKVRWVFNIYIFIHHRDRDGSTTYNIYNNNLTKICNLTNEQPMDACNPKLE